MENYRQLIKETMKQEWEAEFPNREDSAPNFDESIFYHTFGELAERICVKVWITSYLELAKKLASDCQQGMVIPLNVELMYDVVKAFGKPIPNEHPIIFYEQH